MSTDPSAQGPNTARPSSWSNPSTPQIIALALSGAVLVICCFGFIGSMFDGDDSESPTDFEFATESPSQESPSQREITSPPEPTEAPATAAAEAETEAADEGDGASEVYYENCDAARSAGAAPVHEWEEGYGEHLDSDGVGCEDTSGGGSDSDGGGGGNDDDDDGDVYYKNCDAARAAGAAPVHVGEPGYGSHLDRDGDGVGCE